ncbi:disintegrin and metalloproteinase domain-containing protein 10-like [Ornithodoros turicata]|uniref:disintegrin and metalloproteinase domain-containing protein 10-like n=1 Tax=Ornithodoros turicata TaxID=34597 RepID=UPI003139C64D
MRFAVFYLVFNMGQVIADHMNRFIRHYEPLHFLSEPSVLGETARSEGSLETSNSNIRFAAYGKTFHLLLRRDASLFAEDFAVLTPTGKVNSSIDHLHSGTLLGYSMSRVFGSVKGGVFEGYINTGDGTEYYVEPGWKYFGSNVSQYIIYSAADVLMPPDVTGTVSCGVDGMRNLAPEPRQGLQRHKRQVDYIHFTGSPIDDKHTKKPRKATKESMAYRMCNLLITIDHTLYAHHSYGSATDEEIRDRIVTVVASHVDAASHIFSSTNFQGVSGIMFRVETLKVNTPKGCEGKARLGNPFCAEDLDANLILEHFSNANYDLYCSAFIWTFRDFANGVLGLAYVGTPSTRVSGGICQKYAKLNFGGYHRSVTLNTGVVTFVNHGRAVPLRTSQLTFAHELGHSFGANHDKDKICAPGGHDGNYIMYPTSNPGTLANNLKFSSCSIKDIGAVLDSILHERGGRGNCFLPSKDGFCGNNIREQKEECDCGNTDSDCDDKCCYANHNKEQKMGCTLRPNAVCSPTSGACCTTNCRFRSHSHVCSPEDECNFASKCEYPPYHCAICSPLCFKTIG